MSIQALNWALSQDQITNSATRFVLLVLCNYANEDRQCYPSRENIAKKTSLSVRAVQNHLNWLVENGYVTKTDRRFDGKQSTNLYTLVLKQGEPSALRDNVQGAYGDKKQGEPSAHNTKDSYTKEEEYIVDVFNFWKQTMSLNGSTLLTPKRTQKIKQRLAEGYTIERIKNAIVGCSLSPFHNGQNDTRTKYNDIELICRSGEKVEFFEQKATEAKKQTLPQSELDARDAVRAGMDAYGR